MSENNNLDTRFFEALKNSQPIAFLASFSMITAVFSFQTFPLVYTYASYATILFLISLILSIIDQIIRSTDPFIEAFVKYGKFFFFIIGILYLVFIVYEFGKNLPDSYIIIGSWGLMGLGIMFLLPIIKKIGRFAPKFYSTKKRQNIVYTLAYLSSAGLIASGLVLIANTFAVNKISDDLLLGIINNIIIISFILLIIEIILVIKLTKMPFK